MGFAEFIRSRFNLAIFWVYFLVLFAVPVGLLWEGPGYFAGLVIAFLLAAAQYLTGVQLIYERLKLRRLHRAEAPVLTHLVDEYALRLGMPSPKIAVIASTSLNAAAFGYSVGNGHLVVTEGCLRTFNREELSAVIARLMVYLRSPQAHNDLCLARFFALIDFLVEQKPHQHVRRFGRKFYSFRETIKKILLYPLALFPLFILRAKDGGVRLDEAGVKLGGSPQSLSEAYRKMESMQARLPLGVPFALRHLLLQSPQTQDPITRVFFGTDSLRERILLIESQKTMVPLH